MTEKLIYTKVLNVSKESGIENNNFYIRVVMRTYTKPKTWYRKEEKTVVKFDIEYDGPQYPHFENGVCWNNSDKCEQNNKNLEIQKIHNSINSVVQTEIWNVKNMCIDYKVENDIQGTIREFKNGERIRH